MGFATARMPIGKRAGRKKSPANPAGPYEFLQTLNLTINNFADA